MDEKKTIVIRTDRQSCGRINRWTDSQTDRVTNRVTDRQLDRYTDSHVDG